MVGTSTKGCVLAFSGIGTSPEVWRFNHVIRPKIWTERITGKAVVAVHIPEGQASEKPIFISSRGIANGSFRRIGSTDQRCTEDDLRTLLQLADLKPYEDTVLTDASLHDMDQDVIASYRQNLLRESPDTELRDAFRCRVRTARRSFAHRDE